MGLILNDFRNVLGKVNDGNVILSGENGVKKVNFGRIRVKAVHGGNAQENQAVRNAFYAAILSSSEGSALRQDVLMRIRQMLGIGDAAVEGTALMRQTVCEVIRLVDREIGVDGLVNRRLDQLTMTAAKKIGDGIEWRTARMDRINMRDCALSAAEDMKHPAVKDPESMLRLLPPEGFLGHKPEALARIVKGNFAYLRELVFEEICWGKLTQGIDRHAGESYLATAMRRALEDLMTAFAERRNVLPRLERTFRTADPELPELVSFKDVQGLDERSVEGHYTGAGLSGAEDVLNILVRLEKEVHGGNVALAQRMSRLGDLVRSSFRVQANEVLKAACGQSLEARAAFVAQNLAPLKAVAKELEAFADDLLTLRKRFGDGVVKDFLNAFMRRVGAAAVGKGGADGLSAQDVRDALLAEVRAFEGRCSWREQARAAFETLPLAADAKAEVYFERIMARIENCYIGVRRDPADRDFTARFFEDQVIWAYANKGPERASAAMKQMVRSFEFDIEQEIEARLGKSGVMKEKALGLARQLAKPSDGARTDAELTLEGLRKAGSVWFGADALKMGEEELLNAFQLREVGDFDFAVDFARFGFDAVDAEIAAASGDGDAHPLRDFLLDLKFDLRKFNASGAKAFAALMGKFALGGNVTQLDFFPETAKTNASTHYKVYADLVRDRARAAGREKLAKEMDSDPDVDRFVRQFAELKIEGIDRQDIVASAMSTFRQRSCIDGKAGLGAGVVVAATDFAAVAKAFAAIGITPESFNMPEAGERGSDDPATRQAVGREKAILLVHLASRNPTGLFGLDEFSRRVLGKPLAELTVLDLVDMLPKFAKNELADPAAKLPPAARTLGQVLGGARRPSEAGLSLEELKALLGGAKAALAAGAGAKGAEVAVGKVKLVLSVTGDGALAASVDGLPMPVYENAEGLVRILEDEIVRRAGEPGAAASVLETLPPLPSVDAAVSPVRARELYTKALAAKTGELGVVFAALPLAELRALAVDALNGAAGVADRVAALKRAVPATYSSTDVVEMRLDYEEALAKGVKVGEMVKTPPATALRTLEERAALTRPEDVGNLVGDLLMNSDTWGLDEAVVVPGREPPQAGERLRNVLASYRCELDNIAKDPTLLDTLPDAVRGRMKELVLELAALDLDAPGSAARLADAEARLAALAKDAMADLQEKVTAMFPGVAGDARPVAEKSFSEITGAKGLDTSTPDGAFAKKVLDGYFVNSSLRDQLKMLSAVVRNTRAGAADSSVVAELLKGSGPLLQKLLQGLPAESFDKQTQEALKDMKSCLPPIPDDAVKVLLYSLVKNSSGKILSVEVKKTLGAASVGQALLCNVKTPEHPVAGVDCVVKLLRPNALPLIVREKQLIDRLEGVTDEERTAFEDHYASVLEELDLTLEAANVDVGVANYEQPRIGHETAECRRRELTPGKFLSFSIKFTIDPVQDVNTISYDKVHSMARLEGVAATANTMVVKKAPGRTVDGLLRKVRGEAEALVKGLDIRKESAENEEGENLTVTYEVDTEEKLFTCRHRLQERMDLIAARRKLVEDAVSVWVEKALFGDGFFHCDLHAGNVMVDEKGVTFIDFGNCMRLTKDEQAMFRKMLIFALSGDEARFLDLFEVPAAAKDDLRAQLHEVMNKGTANDALSRLHCALVLMRKKGVAVPKTVGAFIHSFVRLNGVMTAMDDELDRLATLSASVRLSPAPEPAKLPDVTLVGTLPPAKEGDEPRTVTRTVPSVFSAIAALPHELNTLELDEEVVGAAFDELMKPYLEGEPPYSLKAELLSLGREPALAALDGLLARFPSAGGSDPASAFNGAVVSLRKAVADYYGQQEVIDGGDPEKRPAAEKALADAVRRLDIFDHHILVHHHEGPSFLKQLMLSLAVKPQEGSSFDELVSNCVQGHSVEMVDFVISNFNRFAGISIGQKMIGSQDVGDTIAARTKRTVSLLAGLNAKAPLEERLAPGEMRRLRKLAKEFSAPAERPYAGADGAWAKSAENRRKVLALVNADLRRLREAFGDELAARHVRYAFAMHSGMESVEDLSMQPFHSLCWALGELSGDAFGQLLAEARTYGDDADPLLADALSAVRELKWNAVDLDEK